MKKLIIPLIQIPIFLAVVTLSCWHVANPQMRSQVFFWVPEVITIFWPGELPEYFQLQKKTPQLALPEESTLSPQSNSANNHGLLEAQCKPKTQAIEVVSTKVYQWVDEEGNTRFSDAPPDQQGIEATTKNFTQSKRFSINIDTQEAQLPPFIRNRLEAQLNQIYRFLSDELNLDGLQQTELNLKLFDDKTSYDNFQNMHAPSLGNTSGFYNPRENIAAIYTAGYNEQAFAITRHESTHAILTSLFGAVPTWHNEGLAEVFEHLTVEGQSRTLPIVKRHLNTILTRAEAQDFPSLEAYWDTSHQQWYDVDKAHRYAVGWALSFYLLSHDEGRALTRKMMQHWLEHPCRHFSTFDFFEAHWPGGVSSFESQWQNWLTSRSITAIRY